MSRAVDLLLTALRAAAIFLWHVAIALPSAFLVALHPRGGEIGHGLFARFWGRATLRSCLVSWTAEGAERLDPRRAYVFAANHASEFDFYALSAALPFQWRALMRPGLGRIPGYGWIARRTGHVFISLREPNTRGRAFAQALAQLAAGRSLLVFPEGRRSYEGDLLPFKTGGFLLAIHAGVPVVPISVREILSAPPRRVLGRGLAHRIRRLEVKIAPPIETTGLTKDDLSALTARVFGVIEAQLHA